MSSLQTHDVLSTFRNALCSEIDWESLQVQQCNKQEFLLSKGASKGRLYLHRLLLKFDIKIIRSLSTDFLCYCYDSCFRKNDLCQGLSSLFFKGEINDITNRKLEHKNIAGLDFSKNESLIKFGDDFLPYEIVVKIFDFIGYSNSTILGVGSVNKTFYIMILRNFKFLNINPFNLYKISLVVLRNVQNVTIDFDFEYNGGIRFFQFDYLFDQLHNVKVLELDTIDVRRTKQVIEMIRQRKKKSVEDVNIFYPFLHISRLAFGKLSFSNSYSQSSNDIQRKKYDQVPNLENNEIYKNEKRRFWSGNELSELFPSCKELINVHGGLFKIKNCTRLCEIVLTINSTLHSFRHQIHIFEELPEFGLRKITIRHRCYDRNKMFDEESIMETVNRIRRRSRDVDRIIFSPLIKITNMERLRLRRRVKKKVLEPRFVGVYREDTDGIFEVSEVKSTFPRRCKKHAKRFIFDEYSGTQSHVSILWKKGKQ